MSWFSRWTCEHKWVIFSVAHVPSVPFSNLRAEGEAVVLMAELLMGSTQITLRCQYCGGISHKSVPGHHDIKIEPWSWMDEERVREK